MNATTNRIEQLRCAQTPAEALHLLAGASPDEVNHVLKAIGAEPGRSPQPALNFGFSAPVVTSTINEEQEPLLRPTVDFSRVLRQDAPEPEPATPAINASDAPVLVMPVLNFTRPGSRKNQTAPKPAAVSNSTPELLMPTPALFPRR